MHRAISPWRALVGLGILALAVTTVVALATRPAQPGAAQASGDSRVFVPAVARHSGLGPLADSRIGVWLGTGDSARVDLLKATGGKWTRVFVNWSTIEPSPGSYSFGAYDGLFTAIGQAGLSSIVEIRGNPGWAATYHCGPIDKADGLDRFEAFVRALVSRYSQAPYNVKHWEFYNEPDSKVVYPADRGIGCWSVDASGPSAYVAMLQRAWRAVKETDPQGKVMLGGLAYENTLSFNVSFLDQVLAAGGAPYFDLANVHYFSSQAGSWSSYGVDVKGKVTALRQVMSGRGVSKPVVVTELSYTNRPEDQEKQARYVAKGLARGLSIDLYAMTWFLLADWSGADYPYGLLTEGLQERTAYRAFQTAARELGQASYRRQLTSDDVGTGGVEGYVFDYGGQERWVLWASSEGGQAWVRVPGAHSEARDKLGNGLALSGGNLVVGDSPVFVRIAH